jgi:hypothetical protein
MLPRGTLKFRPLVSEGCRAITTTQVNILTAVNTAPTYMERRWVK